jgi:hypothetical protein
MICASRSVTISRQTKMASATAERTITPKPSQN